MWGERCEHAEEAALKWSGGSGHLGVLARVQRPQTKKEPGTAQKKPRHGTYRVTPHKCQCGVCQTSCEEVSFGRPGPGRTPAFREWRRPRRLEKGKEVAAAQKRAKRRVTFLRLGGATALRSWSPRGFGGILYFKHRVHIPSKGILPQKKRIPRVSTST